MHALLIIGAILSVTGLLFALGGTVWSFGLGLIGVGCFCAIAAGALKK